MLSYTEEKNRDADYPSSGEWKRAVFAYDLNAMRMDIFKNDLLKNGGSMKNGRPSIGIPLGINKALLIIHIKKTIYFSGRGLNRMVAVVIQNYNPTMK